MSWSTCLVHRTWSYMSWSTFYKSYKYYDIYIFGVRQWVHPDGDKGFEETVSNRRKPYGGQPILQGVTVVASEKEFGTGPILDTIYRYSGI